MLNSAIVDLVQYTKRALAALRGEELWTVPQIRCERLYLGSKRARWCICPSQLSAKSVVYSFGIGEDISFDLELIGRFGLCVHAFDPTPRSLRWLRDQKLPQEFVVHEYGLAAYDGTCTLFPPEDPMYVSHSVIPRESAAHAIEAPVRTLTTIMKSLGHTSINLLKMDIEGAEYDVLINLLAASVKIDQLLVEFHHRWPSIGVNKTRRAIRELNVAGYSFFNVSPSGEEYSFKNIANV